MWRRVNIKIKNSTIMVITAMKHNQKKPNLQNERFSCSFLKVRTNIDLWTKRLIKASKRTSACNGLTGRHTRVVFPLKV